MSSRREFLRRGGALALGASALPPSIARALALPPSSASGSLADVQHVLVLTQENRSFDQIFGTLRGVRGFSDPRAVRLAGGASVFAQPSGDSSLLPYRPAVSDPGMQFFADVDHGWRSSHEAWHGGRYDRWVPSKGPATMQYFTRADIPFHYALADAFTVCDAYHCSMMGPTDPNRYYLWSGNLGNDGRDGGPVIDNSEKGYSWTTLPEALARAGISWKVYQDQGTGLDAAGKWGWTENPYVGNFGDNSLLYFEAYRRARAGDALYEAARGGTRALAGASLFEDLARDVRADRLPKVAWIVAPEAYSEHPNWPLNFGAWYVSRLLDCLTSNPDVWGKTVLFLCYDEAGGFFDHVVPPVPPSPAQGGASTVEARDEVYAGSATEPAGPYGLGNRVPMIVVSPWTRGGWACSEVFDHTSLIRFVERRFGPEHPGLAGAVQISAWRRAVCGDLVSAFDFGRADASVPRLPATAAYAPKDGLRHADAASTLPDRQAMPGQEPGVRPARPLPYDLGAHGSLAHDGQSFGIELVNSGAAGACFHVRGADASGSEPRSYTVEAGRTLSDVWTLEPGGTGRYDVRIYGPDGFYRAFQGDAASPAARAMRIYAHSRRGGGLVVFVKNAGASALPIRLADAYTRGARRRVVAAGATIAEAFSAAAGKGWYDIVVQVEAGQGPSWHLAGHLQDGRPGFSDPALGAGPPPA